MSRRIFQIGERVLANCGTRNMPQWIHGVVLDVYDTNSLARPYQIKLDRANGGKTVWFFPVSYVKMERKK